MAYKHAEKPDRILANQELKQDSHWLSKEDRCLLTVHFILSEHVNAFPRTNVHKEHGGLFSSEVSEVNPIDLRKNKHQLLKQYIEEQKAT